MALLLFLVNTEKLGNAQTITRWQGVVLLLCTVAYIIYTIYEEKKIKNEKIDEEIIKDETDLLLGNISGSNILNLCLLIGLGAVINPLTYTTNFNSSILILIAITIFLQMISTINKKSELNRKRGLFLIIVYILYIWSMI